VQHKIVVPKQVRSTEKGRGGGKVDVPEGEKDPGRLVVVARKEEADPEY